MHIDCKSVTSSENYNRFLFLYNLARDSYWICIQTELYFWTHTGTFLQQSPSALPSACWYLRPWLVFKMKEAATSCQRSYKDLEATEVQSGF